jgi:hypothetical protein
MRFCSLRLEKGKPHLAACWLQKLVNREIPSGKITEEAFRTLQDEVVIPPHKYDDE